MSIPSIGKMLFFVRGVCDFAVDGWQRSEFSFEIGAERNHSYAKKYRGWQPLHLFYTPMDSPKRAFD